MPGVDMMPRRKSSGPSGRDSPTSVAQKGTPGKVSSWASQVPSAARGAGQGLVRGRIADSDLHADRCAESTIGILVDDEFHGSIWGGRGGEPVVVAVDGDRGLYGDGGRDAEAAHERLRFGGPPDVVEDAGVDGDGVMRSGEDGVERRGGVRNDGVIEIADQVLEAEVRGPEGEWGEKINANLYGRHGRGLHVRFAALDPDIRAVAGGPEADGVVGFVNAGGAYQFEMEAGLERWGQLDNEGRGFGGVVPGGLVGCGSGVRGDPGKRRASVEAVLGDGVNRDGGKGGGRARGLGGAARGVVLGPEFGGLQRRDGSGEGVGFPDVVGKAVFE